MHIHHHIDALRDALQRERKAGHRIGFVPTMGNLHAGHLSLIERARETSDRVVCSIFVNGLQFGANEDLDRYPRTFQEDCEKLLAAGCHYLFHPDDREMYPLGMESQTRVVCPTMTDVLCGASRPGHFEGVTTVVSKLFNIVQPDEAVFGAKDYQQLAVIRKMVADLCIPIEIVTGATLREPDGLAMSSRNGFISAGERPRAAQLYQTLQWLAAQLQSGRRDFVLLESEARTQLESAGFRVDYVAIMNSQTLRPAGTGDSELTLLGAMYTQAARLIDNISVTLA